MDECQQLRRRKNRHHPLNVVDESICLFAAIEHAGSLSRKRIENSLTSYFIYRSIVVTCISLAGSTFPSLSI